MKRLLRTLGAAMMFAGILGLPGGLVTGDADGALSTIADRCSVGVLDIQSNRRYRNRHLEQVTGS